MTSGDKPVTPGDASVFQGQLPSLRRIGDFLRNLLDVEHLVRRTDARMGALEELWQRQVDKLKALTTFVSTAAVKAKSKSEESALRTVERYLQALEVEQLRLDGSEKTK